MASGLTGCEGYDGPNPNPDPNPNSQAVRGMADEKYSLLLEAEKGVQVVTNPNSNLNPNPNLIQSLTPLNFYQLQGE